MSDLIAQVGDDPLDLLVNNAGVAVVKPFRRNHDDGMGANDWREHHRAIYVDATYFAPKMPPGSSIVNILSVAAKTGFPNWSAYCMSKFALEGFSQCVREELRDHGFA